MEPALIPHRRHTYYLRFATTALMPLTSIKGHCHLRESFLEKLMKHVIGPRRDREKFLACAQILLDARILLPLPTLPALFLHDVLMVAARQ